MGENEDLSDEQCPLCGRYFTNFEIDFINDIKPNGKYDKVPYCSRCVLTSPTIRDMIEPSNPKSYEALIKKWDENYRTKLSKKLEQ